ncbi:XapX domain-containing protein [Streptomyces cyaneofuscatus]|uniref:XapX domain-containing protein n=1 Tax=Streptomyces cyaneofuscatus TaxID=66883 RepID=UPI003413290E
MRCRTPDRTEYVRGGGRRESPGWASSPLSRPRAAVPRGRTAPEQVPFYLQALSAGVLAGAVYALLRIRSPAPPCTASSGSLACPWAPQP